MSLGLMTYGTDRRESLLYILKDVSPNEDNYLVSNLGVAPTATNTLHSWPTYYTARPTSVTNAVEGADPTYTSLTAPERSSNITAIVNEPVLITGTMKSIAAITGEDSKTFQKKEALKRLKAKMEFLTLNGVIASGASGVARGMAGIDGCISTLVTARASGTSFTETELNDIAQDSWTQVGQDYVADTILAPVVIKRRIATFTANLTRYIKATDKRLDSEIRVYDTQVGQTMKVIAHKDVRAVAGTLTVYALREETFKHSFLADREPMWEELAKTGDAEKGQYITEFTLVSYAQRASVKRTGYATTL